MWPPAWRGRTHRCAVSPPVGTMQLTSTLIYRGRKCFHLFLYFDITALTECPMNIHKWFLDALDHFSHILPYWLNEVHAFYFSTWLFHDLYVFMCIFSKCDFLTLFIYVRVLGFHICMRFYFFPHLICSPYFYIFFFPRDYFMTRVF